MSLGLPVLAQEVPEDIKGLEDGMYARLETNHGVMVLRLEYEKAPITVTNFVGLIEGTRPWTDPRSGQQVKKPFYDGLTFHRIIDGFMIQGGCPLGNGTGSPGYRFRESDFVVRLAAEALSTCGFEPSYALSGGGADANVFNARGLSCLNLANGMMEIHTPDEHIAVADLEAMVEVTLALVERAAATSPA